MKHMRFFLAMILCLSLMTFAGCGNNDSGMDETDSGTVNEQTTETNNNDSSTDSNDLDGGNSNNNSSGKVNDTVNNGNSDGNVVGDSENSTDNGAKSLGKAAEDMKNDVKDAVDGRDITDGNTKSN